MALRLVWAVGAGRPGIRLFPVALFLLRIGIRRPGAAVVLGPAAVLLQPAIVLPFQVFLFLDIPLRAARFRLVRLCATGAGLVLAGDLLFRAAARVGRTGL